MSLPVVPVRHHGVIDGHDGDVRVCASVGPSGDVVAVRTTAASLLAVTARTVSAGGASFPEPGAARPVVARITVHAPGLAAMTRIADLRWRITPCSRCPGAGSWWPGPGAGGAATARTAMSIGAHAVTAGSSAGGFTLTARRHSSQSLHDWGLSPLACASVFPGQCLYQGNETARRAMVRRRSTVRFRNGAPAQRHNSNLSNRAWEPFREPIGPGFSHGQDHLAAERAGLAGSGYSAVPQLGSGQCPYRYPPTRVRGPSPWRVRHR